MVRFCIHLLIACCVVLSAVQDSHAVRVMTSPVTSPTSQFDNIALTSDGSTIITTATFFPAASDRVYSLPVPANPNVDTVTLTQLSTSSFGVNPYDVAFPPVLSPDDQTILFSHDGNSVASNTIYTMPITGEGSSNFTGLFGADPNFASTGDGNTHPVYNGSDVYFLNNNAGFGGSIPIFPSSPVPFDPAPDWDMIYKRSSGGTVTAVTAPGDGDIDAGLFALTPDGTSFVYAPDNPVIEGKDRGGQRPQLFTISTSGGTPTEIPLVAPAHSFSIGRQLEVTADGQTVLFIADYEAPGKNELFSVPIAGGTPTRISDDLHWAGDVSSFAVAPDGLSVAYVAGQIIGANSELFQTPIAGGSGNSIRVSDPAPSNSGEFDVSPSVEGGQIVYSSDSNSIYYLGDLTTSDVNDLYVVDTSEKTGLVPSAFTFTGPSGGDFFDENNWQDADGNNPVVGSIDPGNPIRHALIIDGDTVSTAANGLEADFQVGGSLELTPGSVLDFTNPGSELDFNPGSGFKVTDATVSVHQDILLEGTNVFSGGLIESTADDVEFQDAHRSTISGTTIRSAIDNVLFDNSLTSVTGASFESADRLGLRFEVDVTVVDTAIDVRDGLGDVEDIFAGPQGEGSTLTLDGASSLLANAIQDGVSLVLDGTSVATLLGDSENCNTEPGQCDLVDSTGTITFMSTGAEMVTLNPSASDVRARIINGLTGLSYLADDSAWNVSGWNGIDTLASLMLLPVGVEGDYNGNGIVDAADYAVWLTQLGATGPGLAADGNGNNVVDDDDYTYWKTRFGNTSALNTADLSSIPEPSAGILAVLAMTVFGRSRFRYSRSELFGK